LVDKAGLVRRAVVRRFEWNALRVGDKVMVHDPGSIAMALVSGVVAAFNTLKGSNSVGIRIAATEGGAVIICPPRQAVHLPASDPTESCWRCETLRGPA
jgi:hypothetical protein